MFKLKAQVRRLYSGVSALSIEEPIEINQEPVSEPSAAAEKFKTLKSDGKKSALLLVANAQGEVRFVAVPVD